MKLMRIGEPGREVPAILDAEGLRRDLSSVIPDLTGPFLSDDTLRTLSGVDTAGLPILPDTARTGPCVGGVGKFVCIGLNYRDHAEEGGMPIPAEPVIFMKATSAIVGPDDDVRIPRGSTKTDWEVELGVVIGRHASGVEEGDALAHIAGYCVINDVSERAFQLERGGSWDKGKGCDTFGPMGPWLVTRDEIPNVQNLRLWLDIDGIRQQDGTTADMIFPVAHLVSYVSQFMSLHPGDIISTGTPAGVGLGKKPEPVFLRRGQQMRLGIVGLGQQTQRVI